MIKTYDTGVGASEAGGINGNSMQHMQRPGHRRSGRDVAQGGGRMQRQA